ncbi:kinase-like domain-containing protein [Aspergillus bertholletiae]|uniref:Kinase-like domain-containing protein n=1 Tax=Aspergillus bertholletiae TaxID=1226010 RepID=A0A5N7AX12_9EURO|nr:kinase-like domain-containing protein [Aspergillus bertholletiae]
MRPFGWPIKETVVIKGVEIHPRVKNERDVLKRFQNKTSGLQPIVDEIEDPPQTTTARARPLNRKGLRFVSLCILDALNGLHEGGYYLKPDNILCVISDVRLGDLGGTCHIDSKGATSGTPLGAPMWRSPEMIMETPWGTPTDIWSYGTVLVSLIYGGDFNLFDPVTVPYGHEEYSMEILKQQFRYFGPWPGKYEKVASPETLQAIRWIMQEIPKSETTQCAMITENEVCNKNMAFIMEIMKFDWRDRPSARKLLVGS